MPASNGSVGNNVPSGLPPVKNNTPLKSSSSAASNSSSATPASPPPPSSAPMRAISRRLPASASGYTLRQQIGRGTAASVYRALCTPTDQDESMEVAVKVIDLEWLQAPLDDIWKEIQVMSLSSHPNVVPFSTAFINGADLWVVMPLLTGGSVLELMHECYPNGLPENIAVFILYSILKALDYFHGNSQIHRDVKARNILLDSRGNVMLSDYGMMGWMVEGGWDRKQRQTFIGTPCWMAPEVMEQTSGYDYKADIWSLGITAIEIAQGMAPYTTAAPMKVLLMILQNPPPTLEENTAASFSEEYKDFVKTCLQKDPDLRPSASKLLQHPLFANGVPQPRELEDLLAKMPPVGSREGGSGTQKTLFHQLSKNHAVARSGIFELSAKGQGWDFGDGDFSMPNSSTDTLTTEDGGSIKGNTTNNIATAKLSSNNNNSTGTTTTSTGIGSEVLGTSYKSALVGNDEGSGRTSPHNTAKNRALLTSAASEMNASGTGGSTNSSIALSAKASGHQTKGRFTVLDVGDQVENQLADFLDDDSSTGHISNSSSFSIPHPNDDIINPATNNINNSSPSRINCIANVNVNGYPNHPSQTEPTAKAAATANSNSTSSHPSQIDSTNAKNTSASASNTSNNNNTSAMGSVTGLPRGSPLSSSQPTLGLVKQSAPLAGTNSSLPSTTSAPTLGHLPPPTTALAAPTQPGAKNAILPPPTPSVAPALPTAQHGNISMMPPPSSSSSLSQPNTPQPPHKPFASAALPVAQITINGTGNNHNNNHQTPPLIPAVTTSAINTVPTSKTITTTAITATTATSSVPTGKNGNNNNNAAPPVSAGLPANPTNASANNNASNNASARIRGSRFQVYDVDSKNASSNSNGNNSGANANANNGNANNSAANTATRQTQQQSTSGSSTPNNINVYSKPRSRGRFEVKDIPPDGQKNSINTSANGNNNSNGGAKGSPRKTNPQHPPLQSQSQPQPQLSMGTPSAQSHSSQKQSSNITTHIQQQNGNNSNHLNTIQQQPSVLQHTSVLPGGLHQQSNANNGGNNNGSNSNTLPPLAPIAFMPQEPLSSSGEKAPSTGMLPLPMTNGGLGMNSSLGANNNSGLGHMGMGHMRTLGMGHMGNLGGNESSMNIRDPRLGVHGPTRDRLVPERNMGSPLPQNTSSTAATAPLTAHLQHNSNNNTMRLGYQAIMGVAALQQEHERVIQENEQLRNTIVNMQQQQQWHNQQLHSHMAFMQNQILSLQIDLANLRSNNNNNSGMHNNNNNMNNNNNNNNNNSNSSIHQVHHRSSDIDRTRTL